MMSLKQKLIKIIAESLECEKSSINENSGLGKHQNWDSLQHVVIIVNIEKAFSIEIEDLEIEKLLTFDDLFKYLEKNSKINK